MAKTQFSPSQQSAVPPKRILGVVAALLIFILLLLSVIRLGEKYFALRARNRELITETAALQQKETDLVNTNAYLSSPQGTEASLREQYNYVKPGEGMIIITPQASATTPEAPQSTVSRWWDDLVHGLGAN